jgi:membrane protein required for colicin V production
MTLYDAAMVGLILGGMVWGAWRGIVWQIASIASLVLGYTVAHTTSDDLASHFPGDPVVARGLAMLVVYAAVSGGVFLAAWLVRATLRRLKFEAYDRHLGMVLGGLEGALVGMVATLFIVSLAPQSRGPIFASPSGKVVGRVMGALGPVLPSEAREVLAPFWDGRAAVVEAGRKGDQNPGGVEQIRTSESDHGRGRSIERR